MLSRMGAFLAAQATFLAIIAQSVARFHKADNFHELVDPLK